jgi:Growth-Arrest-Specific Protein 2 Domain
LTKFEVLRRNKRLKKQILDILKKAKNLRLAFNNLRGRYEGCKLKLKALPKYKPLQGDDVDRMIAEWIHLNCCPIPIERLGNGYYTFGQKKIFAKITNGKLVIRVGGGYMGIDEFMYYYGA